MYNLVLGIPRHGIDQSPGSFHMPDSGRQNYQTQLLNIKHGPITETATSAVQALCRVGSEAPAHLDNSAILEVIV